MRLFLPDTQSGWTVRAHLFITSLLPMPDTGVVDTRQPRSTVHTSCTGPLRQAIDKGRRGAGRRISGQGPGSTALPTPRPDPSFGFMVSDSSKFWEWTEGGNHSVSPWDEVFLMLSGLFRVLKLHTSSPGVLFWPWVAWVGHQWSTLGRDALPCPPPPSERWGSPDPGQARERGISGIYTFLGWSSVSAADYCFTWETVTGNSQSWLRVGSVSFL